jgi:hypothetical protein
MKIDDLGPISVRPPNWKDRIKQIIWIICGIVGVLLWWILDGLLGTRNL